MSVEIKDLGIGRLKEDLSRLGQTEITIGWQGRSGQEQHPEADANVSTVAAWMEYGTTDSDGKPKVPARPALQTTFANNDRKFKKVTSKAVSDIIDGRNDVKDAITGLGNFALRTLRKTMDQSRTWATPLAESTVKHKGHDQPLLDSGTMRDKASWAERCSDRILRQEHDSYADQGSVDD